MQSVRAAKSARSRQRGFTLVELAVATAVLLFGVVAVMQLVPTAMETNQANRYDTTSVVVAQHYLDIFGSQPLTAPTFTDPVCGAMLLGTPAAGTTASGNPIVMFNGFETVSFAAGAVAGYNCNYVDPNSPSGGAYEVRWGVIITENANGRVTMKRFVVGVRRQASQFRFPVNLTATVQR